MESSRTGWKSEPPWESFIPSRIRGVFPPVEDQSLPSDQVAVIASADGSHVNYSSAESDSGTVQAILDGMVDKGWALKFDSSDDLRRHYRGSDFTVNKLALISKVKSDGTTKHRIVWDLSESGVNSFVHQGQRVVLPRVSDVITDMFALASVSPDPQRPDLYVISFDISDAFHQMPLSVGRAAFHSG